MPGDLGLTLNNALSSLRVNQQQLSVLSQNIANANTAGYSRQTITQQAVYLDGNGDGVNAADVTRKVDEYLNKAVQQKMSDVGQSDVLNDYYSRIQLQIGTPGNQNSIDSYINTFASSVHALAQTPQSTTLQQGVVNNGVTLANQIQQLAGGLQNLQYQADQDIGSAIKTVNADLANISKLNKTIVNNGALGKGVSELQDQRDSLVQDISTYININTFPQTNGSISLTTGNGVSILDNNVYQLGYSAVGSPGAFSDGTTISPLTLTRVDDNGNAIGTPVNATTSGTPSQITSIFTSGKIQGLLSLRDQLLPNVSGQLDTLAATVRDQFNAIHNSGSGYPGSNSLTGTRSVYGSDASQWSGSVRIAVLDSNGQPAASPYADEPNGIQPYTLDLSTLDTGAGIGTPSVQGIIDAINQHYGVPQNKAEIGNINNAQLVSATKTLPSTSGQFSFGLDLSNLSGTSSNVYVSNVTVIPNTGGSTPVTSTIPNVALASTGTYITNTSDGNVIINTAGLSNGLKEGEIVYLSTPPTPPSGSYDGIPPASLGGYFTISNVTATSFQISTNATGAAGLSIDVPAQTAKPPYAQVAPGGDILTNSNGLFTADLTGATGAQYYTVTASVGVDDGSGIIKTSNVTYRVNNSQPNLLGTHIGAQTASGNGTIITSTSTNKPLAVATLVDKNGNEIPKTNGVYNSQIPGFLKITAGTSSNVIAIDSLNSAELGKPNSNPPVPASNRGFSYYFNMNDFFTSNSPGLGANGISNSALNLQVESRIQNTPGLLSLGQLAKSSDPVNTTLPPNYTYQLNPGDNSIIQKLSDLSTSTHTFSATGGMGVSVQTMTGYAGQIIGAASTNAATAKSNGTNSQTLLDGFTKQASAVSGVNLDTELANTVIYQNAYSASARIITVANSLFDTLLQSIQ